ncbi:MAG: TlpA family protein disulfide reductase [Anaerolineales bacterium]
MSKSDHRAWVPMAAGIGLGVALGAVIFFGLPSQVGEAPAEVELQPAAVNEPGLLEGSPAPDFQLSRADGGSIRLGDYRGKVVLLNFWATWCLPCRSEMPLIQTTYEQLGGQGFVALGVDFDEPAEVVTAFGNELEIGFPLLLDPGGEVQRLYRVVGYPTSVILDREGRITAYHIGILAKSQLDLYLEQAGLKP